MKMEELYEETGLDSPGPLSSPDLLNCSTSSTSSISSTSNSPHLPQPDLHLHLVSLLAFSLFGILYLFIAPLLSSLLSLTYTTLDRHRRLQWNAYVTSTFHAIIVTIIAFHQIFFSEKNPKEGLLISGFPCLKRLNCGIVFGYMSLDLITLLANWDHAGDVGIAIHHLLCIFAYHDVIVRGAFCWFANFRLLCEASTPFLNLRWFLDISGLKTHRIYAINGVCILLIFFVVRILAAPIYYTSLIHTLWWTSSEAAVTGTSAATEGPWTPAWMAVPIYWTVTAFVVPLAHDILNLWWFSKICKGVLKLFRVKVEGKRKSHLG